MDTHRLLIRVSSIIASLGLLGLFIIGCSPKSIPVADRLDSIPSGAIKVTPMTDENPPRSLSDEYDSPFPLPGEVNTAGGEDSPFISPDGNVLYFWFTPDVR